MSYSLNILRASLSGATSIAVDKVIYGGGDKLISAETGKRFALQAGASLSANTVKTFLMPYLPNAVTGLGNEVLTPLVVGGVYLLLTMVFKTGGSGSKIKTFLVAAGSEATAAYMEGIVAPFVYSKGMITSGNVVGTRVVK